MNTKISAIAGAACLFAASSLHAQKAGSGVSNDSLSRKYTAMSRSSDPIVLATMQSELYGLLRSKEEGKWNVARSGFYQMKKGAVADSIQAVMVKKFPKGTTARGAATSRIYDEKDPVKMEALYKAWIKKFPPESFDGEKIQYDYVAQALARRFAEEGNTAKALEYGSSFYTGPWSGEGFAGVAMGLMKGGDSATAGELLKKAIGIAEQYLNEKKNEYGAGFAAMGFPSYCTMYADILVSQKNYEEALAYVDKAAAASKTPRPGLNATRAKILMALNRRLEAFQAMTDIVAEGQADAPMRKQWKELYASLNGSEAGLNAFESGMKQKFLEKLKSNLAKQMVSEPAAPFTVKDATGKQVSLSDYKGKVVVLDFWATWCGPCKRSFPAMQMAVDKYAQDKDVHFLFVDTWENVADYEAEVSKFITENKYRFHVVFDPRHPETKESAVANAYSVKGIPAKFVIDGNGKIRFKMTGFSGGNEAAVEELSEMIEMARKS